MSNPATSPRVAIIGAGTAGASCARSLASAGFAVQVFDKARGPGGRLATRRLEWLDAQGHLRRAKVDHGAPAFAARGADFKHFLAAGPARMALARWSPTPAPDSRPVDDDANPLWLPVPDMPSLCRALLHDIPAAWSSPVEALRRQSDGWWVDGAGSPGVGPFDAVVLAVPPAQAVPLLAAHHGDWAQRASLALMQPCWTLLGVALRPSQVKRWDVIRPERGPLAWAMNHDSRPGRAVASGEVHWVAHARAGWSRQHLEQPAEWVLAELQQALQQALGEAIDWQHAVVHRWRYATAQTTGTTPAGEGWWDAHLGLGVCGDFLGDAGVEGAWLSARALAACMARDLAASASTPTGPPIADPEPLRAAA